MQASTPAHFDRDMGCTEAEWLHWLPGATRGHALAVSAGAAHVGIGSGELRLAWQVLPPRRIALLCIPRLTVAFRFEGVDDVARLAFMRHFDLYMQRGGG